MFLDRPYEVQGRAVGDSPKTEDLRWDATARDERGEAMVTMRHLLRFLRASSPLYGAWALYGFQVAPKDMFGGSSLRIR
jgi:hypothetical protein